MSSSFKPLILNDDGSYSYQDPQGNVLLHGEYDKPLHSVTVSNGVRISKASDGPLTIRLPDGSVETWFFEKLKGWSQAIEAEALPEPEESIPESIRLPSGCKFKEVRIKLTRDIDRTILQEHCHYLPHGLALTNGGSVIDRRGNELGVESELMLEDEEYSIEKVIHDNFSWVVILDKKHNTRYRFRYALSPKYGSGWYQLFVELNEFDISNRISKIFIPTLLIRGLLNASIGVAAIYAYLFFVDTKQSLLLWLPLVIAALYVLASLICALDPFRRVKSRNGAFAMTIGPYRFFGDGHITTDSGESFAFSDEIDEQIDGFSLKSRPKNSVQISHNGIQAEIFVGDGIVRIGDTESVENGSAEDARYSADDGFCVFTPAPSEFRVQLTDCGNIHDGFHGPPKRISFDVGGVEFHADGTITFGNVLVETREGFSQTIYKDILICKVAVGHSRDSYVVRIVKQSEGIAWHYSYVFSESWDYWNKWTWRGQ